MIPYLYTMNYRSYAENMPLIEPMYYEYPENAEAYEVKNQYFFGSQLMVAPVTTPITPAATPLAAATPVAPVAPAAPAPAATPAATPAAQNTPIQDAQVPLAVNDDEDNLQNIEDEDTPLAAGGTAKDGIKTWWWWIATAVAAITGKGVYDNRRRKPAKNDESDDESKQK